jgi:hypothetical protein
MDERRQSLLLLIAVAALLAVGGFYIRRLHNAAEEATEDARAGLKRNEELRRDAESGQKELKRLQSLRDSLEGDVRRLETRLKHREDIEGIPEVLKQLRGYALLRPLRVRFVDRAFTRKFAEGEIRKQVTSAYAKAYATTFARLGLLPPDFALVESILALMAEQAAGFYDPRTKILYVNDGLPAAEMTLSHEIAHALADQRFDLKKLLDAAPLDNDDRVFALRALIEGDATAVMLRYLRATISLAKVVDLALDVFQLLRMDQRQLEAAPAWIRVPLTRAYLDGAKFIEALERAGGWPRVDAAFDAPPESSEQILHPQRYLAGERPVAVTLPDLAPIIGHGARAAHENTLGELGLRILLSKAAPSRAAAEAAAEGWGGDRLRSYIDGAGRHLLVWRIVMDTNRDADELEAALTRWLDGRYGARDGGAGRWRASHGLSTIVRRKRELVVLDGARDEREATAVLEAM